MDYKLSKSKVFLRLDPDEEIKGSILRLADKLDIKSASISGIGAVNDVTLRFLKQDEKDFIEKRFKENFEVTALVGNLSTKNGEPYLHIHITLANSYFQAIAGHCHAAIIGATAEIILDLSEDTIARRYNHAVGLDIFSL